MFEHERREGQPFVVDLVLGLDTARAAASDDLADTVDYGGLALAVKSAVERDPVDLIETLAERIAGVCSPTIVLTGAGSRSTSRRPPSRRRSRTWHSRSLGRSRLPVTETPNPHIVDADTLTGEMRPIRQLVVSLGSNLGDRIENLQGAVRALADTPDVWVTGVSPVYETEPVDAPDGSDKFLNAVVLADTTLAASRLMDRAMAIEDAFDRQRSEVLNAPRTLDVDLIVVGDRRSDDDYLRLPHPRAAERAFVLRPWLDVDPGAELLGHGPVAELLAAVGESGVERRDDLVLDVE